MSLPTRIAVIAAAALVGIWLLGGMAGRRYFTPRADLVAERDELQETLDRWNTSLERRGRLDARLDELHARTLGGDVESVDHRLRTRLNRIAEECGLGDITVGTTSPSSRGTPARRAMSNRGLWRELRDEIDFVVVDGSVNGEGTLEQAVQLVLRVEREPWIKRVHTLRLEPRDNGARVLVTVRLTTLFVRGEGSDDMPVSSWDDSALAEYARFIAANPFRVPPAPEPARVEETRVEPPTPPAFPWGDWLVTGAAIGPEGPEIWLRNTNSGESRRLTVGQSLNGATLLAVDGERVSFRMGEEAFAVFVGSTLRDRQPIHNGGASDQ